MSYAPELSTDPLPDHTGKHPAGTILANFTEAVRLYGVPKGAFDHDRWHPYGTGH